MVAVTGSAETLKRCAPAGRDFAVVAPERISEANPDVVVAFAPTSADREYLQHAGFPSIFWYEDVVPDAIGDANREMWRAVGDSGQVWRDLALPVADGLYSKGIAAGGGAAAWLGTDGPRRRDYLRWFPRDPEIGTDPSIASVVVSLRMEDDRASHHQAVTALAQGRLLISETLSPPRGLEPGCDYLEGRDLTDIFHAVSNATRAPAAFRRTRLRGRRKAELFRSSEVVRRLAGDLLLELGR